MRAFFKTLFGDFHNLAFVSAVVGATALLVHFGYGQVAVYAVPATLLFGVGWFATR
ncbi:MAG: hypothetical protein RB191_04680 [Terriglobia bacterium]|nr:hypothetical protein [Terriglobia bacterium]